MLEPTARLLGEEETWELVWQPLDRDSGQGDQMIEGRKEMMS